MIERALVIENPFDDIVPRITQQISKKVEEKILKQSLPVNNKNLISFDDEDGEE